MESKTISEFIRKNMNGMHGVFSVAATDLAEKEPGCVRVFITNTETETAATFDIFADGREERNNEEV